MRRHLARRASLLCYSGACCLGAVATLQGQTGASASREATPPWRVGVFVGLAQHSPVGTHWGITPDRNHFMVGLHASTTILALGPLRVAYAPEFLPIVRVSNNPTYHAIERTVGGRLESLQVEDGRAPVFGVALAPLGLEADLAPSSRVQLFSSGGVGGIWFTREVPVVGSRAFNYTFDFGGGTLLRLRSDRWLVLGYKFHHLSNVYTALKNPGLDANLFYLGWQRRLGRGRP